MSTRVKTARLIFFLLAGAILTYFLLSSSGSGSPETTVRNIMSAVKGSDPAWLVAGFLFFILSQAVRAWRWQLISHGHSIPFSEALTVTAIHVGLGHLLPVRMADVALVGLFRKRSAIPLGYGTSTVILAKIMDVIAMGSVVALSFIWGLSGPVVYVAGAAAVLGAGSLFFLPGLFGLLSASVSKVFGHHGRVASAWRDVVSSMRITGERRRSVSLAMGSSLAAWALKLFMFNALLHSVGVTGLPLWQVFTASAVTDLIMALPVHGLLGMGTMETGWVAGFALVGLSGTLSGDLTVVEAGFTVHLLWLSMAVFPMLAGIIRLLISARRDEH